MSDTFASQFGNAWRESDADGMGGSTPHKPIKSEIQAIGASLDARFEAVEGGQAAGFIVYETWAELDAHPEAGLDDGVGAKVYNDAGTHVDPIEGGSPVANEGVYSFVAGSPSGFKRIANLESEDASGFAAAAAASAVAAAADAYSNSFFPGQGGVDATSGERAAFARVKRFELRGAPANKVPMLSTFAWKDVDNRFTLTGGFADDIDGTNYAAAFTVTVSDASAWNEARRAVDLIATGSTYTGVTGVIEVDFSIATAIAVYPPSTSGKWNTRVLAGRVGTKSTARTNELNAAIDARTATALQYRSRLPFTATQTDANVRALVRDVKVYGAKDTTDVKKYAISHISISDFGAYKRLLVDIIELGSGSIVARGIWNNYAATDVADFLAILAADLPVLTCNDYVISDKTRMQVRVEFDWSKVTGVFTWAGTTDAFGGIHPDCVFLDEETSDYLDSDHWHEVIRVSVGSGNLRAAVEALYSPITGATLIYATPLCERASYHHRILLDLVDDGDYEATGLAIPNFVDIRGNGVGRTWIKRENTDPDPLLEWHGTSKILDVSFYQETASEYCVHSDLFQRLLMADGVNSPADDDDQNFRTWQKLERFQLIGAPGNNAWLFGCGISAGQKIRFVDGEGYHEDSTASAPAFGFHNTGPTASFPSIQSSYNGAHVEMRGVTSRNTTGVSLITLEPSAICTLSLHACGFNKIGHSVTAGEVVGSGADRMAWEIIGDYRGPWENSDGSGDAFTQEWTPIAAPKRRVKNTSGATIPRGTLVVFTGLATIGLCAPGDRPDGWVRKDIANNADGDVVLTRRVSTQYLLASTASTGPFGIDGAGQIDYAAPVKVGKTRGGVVELW